MSWRVDEAVTRAEDNGNNDGAQLILDAPLIKGVIDARAGTSFKAGIGHIRPIPAELAALVSESLTDVSAGVDAGAFVRALTKKIYDWKLSRDVLPLPTSGDVSFAVLNTARNELWRVGGLWVKLDDSVWEPNGRLLSGFFEFRRAFMEAQVAKGWHPRDLAENTDASLQAAYHDTRTMLANHLFSDFGHGCINGKDVPDKFVETRLLLPDAKRVIIGTESLYLQKDTFSDNLEEMRSVVSQDPVLAQVRPWIVGISRKDAIFPAGVGFMRLAR